MEHNLEPADEKIIACFAERRVNTLPISTIAVATGFTVDQVLDRGRGILKQWIDTMFVDEWSLTCDVADLPVVADPADATPSATKRRVASGPGVPTHAKPVTELPPLSLYPWQTRAIQAWERSGRRGIVEAVTGTGKTRVGLAAARWAVQSSSPTYPLIVVPKIQIMDQWCRQLEAMLPGRKIMRIGGGQTGDFSSPLTAACVAVVNSLVLKRARKLDSLLQHCRTGSGKSMLIADECHRYADGEVFGRLLQFPFDYALGLSATAGDYEIEGLGRVVYEYGFKDAHVDGLVPNFALLNATVELTPREWEDYLKLDDRARDAFKRVMKVYPELEYLDGEQMFQRMKSLMGPMGSGNAPAIERLYKLWFKRAAISYTARDKMLLGARLLRHLVEHQRKKVLVFFERIDSAEDVGERIDVAAARALKDAVAGDDPIRVWQYHSQMPMKRREQALAEFRDAGPSALLACRSLDEGLDVPDVDAAILVASTQSPRQRIQRIGRTLRRGDGGKHPVIVTLMVKGTSDSSVAGADSKSFGGVATIHEVQGKDCLATLRAICGE